MITFAVIFIVVLVVSEFASLVYILTRPIDDSPKHNQALKAIVYNAFLVLFSLLLSWCIYFLVS